MEFPQETGLAFPVRDAIILAPGRGGETGTTGKRFSTEESGDSPEAPRIAGHVSCGPRIWTIA